ncbi:hypothetical protein PFICI_06469 [Pestalotiopsis fici W106-1]|uniref:Heterokaryon incompatibility domain-containing protein n=1 Tax=Pestalotiopsis fici (strain W106-1 / CGMCC3.15140) TaxID=1229662 RepID=W3X7U5_PESFW|nr:uncharacterized protein PFICI_06469 [Pestalotiopsis fici W106-1]ETS81467.1 hypothetical protein PFICI_06469 [Pestalotiopsis fici W106-1]
MFNASFDENMLVPYEALSYCWGDNRLTHTIRVNGKALAITHNLYTALMHLRFNEKDRMLWIDAVCIDQGNVQERGHQVDNMGDVYRRADQVLFWLGRVEDNVGTLMNALNSFEENVPSEALEQWPNGDSRFHHIWSKICKRRHFRDLRWELRSLMDDDWFNRVWIIQEVFNAKKASVGCTDGWVSPRVFALAPSLLQVRPSNQCQAIIDIMPGPLRKSSWWNQNPNLSTLLWKFRESQATDSRDRVFALLGIASDKPFRSDYSKSEMIVVKDVFEYLCRDNFPINSMRTSSIEELQNTVPSLVYMGLDQFVSPGKHMDVMKQFRYRHNKQVFLSEAAVGYLWHINSPLKEQLTHESGIVQVVVGQKSANSTESLSTYLEQERGQNAIQGSQIHTQENSFNFEYTMLESGQDEIQLAEILTLEAARNGSNVFERFLHNNGEQVVLSSDVIAAADNRGLNILDLLLCRHYDQISITDALLVDAIRSYPEKLRIFLDTYRDQLKITETSILEAITAGPKTLKLLLEACRESLVISQSMAEAGFQRGPDNFRALLVERGNQLEIDSAISNAALEKGVDEFKVLIDQYGDRVTCTNAMIVKAIRQKSNTLKYLIDRYGDQITCTAEMIHVAIHEGSDDALEVLPDRYRDRSTCTAEMVLAAIRSRPNELERLLDRYGDQITCTTEMICAAIDQGKLYTLKALLDRYGDQITCTNEMVLAAIDHGGFRALEALLDRYGDQITYTAEMVYAAIDHGGFYTLEALLDRYGDQIDIKSIATRALCHSSTPKKLELLLDRYGDRVDIPADAFNNMLRFGKVDNLTMLLDRCGDRNDVLKALIRIEDKWAFRRHAARTLIVQGHMNVYPWFRVLASALGDALAQRFRSLAMLMGGEFNELNELLLHPSLLL